MSGIVFLVALFIVFGFGLGLLAFVAYRRILRRAKGIERGLKMVPLLIHLPPPSDDVENPGTRSTQDMMREKVSQAQVLYDLIAGTAQAGFKSSFYGQRHIALEIVASNGLIHFFAAVPISLVSVVEQAIVTAYPGARIEEVEDHNVFNPQGKLVGTVGGELVLKAEAAYPIATISSLERDPMEGLLNALSKLQLGDGAAIQLMLRPANPAWTKNAKKIVAKVRHTREGGLGFSAVDIAKATVKTSEEWRQQAATFEPSKLEEQMMQAVEEKTKHPGYEVLIRVLTSSPTYDRSQVLLRNIVTAFALYEAAGSNGFKFIEGRDMQGLITAFIFRFFPPEVNSNVLNSVELATLFHLPDAQFTATSQVERQHSKQVDGPVNMPATGLLMGYNFYRGVKKEIRLSPEDRRRHTYIVGQTGTGKSTILENLAVQDMLAGNGFAFIDPHGDTAEKLISMIPKERAEDVIYFNPGDMEHPLGLNLFEYDTPEQKDFLVQESINMLYKLYDPGKTGIIGPRFEHWYRNAALTLMADPHGASFIEIPKVFTDTAYLKTKFKYLNDPTVIDFWTKEMGQTSDYHKSEMLGWFVSKFGAFQSNEMMRNIIGQTSSSFNLRDVMDNKKILIVNLGKGQVGELNAQLLGMIFVMKFQAAAMSRSSQPEAQRTDFCLYVDEFQNFSTDSFASILSEARKYRLNLIVANQFIGQLSDEIREAVFGNVGTIMSYRCGPEDAEFLVKQFEPVFDVRDLVNLPNYNAVMKLLLGGLPSQPFSITALPPLGQPQAEMGLAIKQLSAAKFGVPRGVVEADIFARLQNQPRPSAAPAPAPAAAAAPAPQAVAAAPAVDHEAMLPPATIPAPAATPTPASAATPAPPAPKPAPSKPDSSDDLSLSDLRAAGEAAAQAAEAQVEESMPMPVAAPVPAPSPEPSQPEEPLLIEAHEDDGKVEQPAQPSAPAPAPAAASAPVPDPAPIPEPAPVAPAPAPAPVPTPKPAEIKPEHHRLADKPPAPKNPSRTPSEQPVEPQPVAAPSHERTIKPPDAVTPDYVDAAKPKPSAEAPKPSQSDPTLPPDEIKVGEDGSVEIGKDKPVVLPTSPIATPKPTVKTDQAATDTAEPELKPGEVYVDEQGNVVQG